MKTIANLKNGANLLLAVLTITSSSLAQARSLGGSTGGGNSEANSKLLLQKLIESEEYEFKSSLKHYLNAIRLNQVSDPVVKRALERIGVDRLTADISRSRYLVAPRASEALIPKIGNKTGVKMQPAATTEFYAGADVRFDLDLLFNETKDLAQEDRIIAVASLALHEHIHHFQATPRTKQERLADEAEAYAVSGYVLISAKFAEVPVLTWQAVVPGNPGSVPQTAPVCQVTVTKKTADGQIVGSKTLAAAFRQIPFNSDDSVDEEDPEAGRKGFVAVDLDINQGDYASLYMESREACLDNQLQSHCVKISAKLNVPYFQYVTLSKDGFSSYDQLSRRTLTLQQDGPPVDGKATTIEVIVNNCKPSGE